MVERTRAPGDGDVEAGQVAARCAAIAIAHEGHIVRAVEQRLQAVCDLMIPVVRENAGLHDYDGVIQDLSPDGVAAGLARLGPGRARAAGADPGSHDEVQLGTFEDLLRVSYG